MLLATVWTPRVSDPAVAPMLLHTAMELPIVDDPVADLRAEQQRLAALVDQSDQAAPDTDEQYALFKQVSAAVTSTFRVRSSISRRQREAAIGHYAPRTRIAAGIAGGGAALAAVAVLLGWMSGWLLLLLVPQLLLGAWLMFCPARGADDTAAAADDPQARFLLALGVVLGVVLTVLAGLVSAWFLLGVVPVTAVTVFVAAEITDVRTSLAALVKESAHG